MSNIAYMSVPLCNIFFEYCTSPYQTLSILAYSVPLCSVNSDGVCHEEKNSAFASSSKSRLEQDGVVAEKESGLKHKSRVQKINDTIQQASETAAMASNRLKVVKIES